MSVDTQPEVIGHEPEPQPCAQCADKGNPTSHEPSIFCQSGKRPHCTCDCCF